MPDPKPDDTSTVTVGGLPVAPVTAPVVGNDSDYVDDPVFGKQPKDVATQIRLQEQARLDNSKQAASTDAATEAAIKAAKAV